MGSISGPELLIILAIILLVFGGTKLPQLARSLGQAQREFKRGLDTTDDEPADGSAKGATSTSES